MARRVRFAAICRFPVRQRGGVFRRRTAAHRGQERTLGYADEHGTAVIEPRFAFGFPFGNGRAKVTDRGREMKEVPGSGGEYRYRESDRWYYIDGKGIGCAECHNCRDGRKTVPPEFRFLRTAMTDRPTEYRT